MPLTAKGEEIKRNLVKEYGAKKGEQVLYAGKNAGTFTGIDSAKLDSALKRADDFDGLVKKLENKGYSAHYAKGVAGKVAQEKGK